MARYTPPEQSKALQIVDIGFLILAIFAALWLPLKLGAGAEKTIDKIDNPTWSALGQNPTMVAAWEKLGYTPQTAHDVIQNHYHYDLSGHWLSLIIMAAVLIGYFVFLFRASDVEYRDVIAEKFGDKK
jgi:hypothetical protein